MQDRIGIGLLGWALAMLALGLALRGAAPETAALIWTAGVLPVLAALGAEIVQGLRRGEAGLDILAALSMSAALAAGEPLAAAVVAVMYAGGSVLESLAQGRARHEMRALLARVPRTALRHEAGRLREIAIDDIRPGDRLLIRQGDLVPVDGTVAAGKALLDTAALTGESLPRHLAAGAEALSGARNAGPPFDLLASRPAADSTFAAILRLVAAAQAARAPMARLADRWSLAFLALSLAIAGAAWAVSGDPIRAVAVLVVATPCPLILAVPVALVAGLSRAARQGVLIKGAGALERMARARVLILDKTGTLTGGQARIIGLSSPTLPPERLLALAAGLEQASPHPLARALVAAAQARGLTLAVPQEVEDTPGEGLTGRVEGRQVVLGSPAFVAARVGGAGMPAADPGTVIVAVGIDGQPAGHLALADPLRSGMADLLAQLRATGIGHILLATGDRAEIAAHVTRGLGLDAIHADLSPAQKLALVERARALGPVMMVGDGVNDAPALAAADVGVAMGARGAAASAEAADAVLLVDSLAHLLPGIVIARGARTIALQSVALGIGLSLLGMGAAAAGMLSPVQGALLQEAIDVAAILNALRALRIRTPALRG